MKQRALLVVVVVFCLLLPMAHAEDSTYECATGDSTEDRVGCLDSDGDGWSDPDDYWNESMGADAFPDDDSEHRDLDGDGLGDVIDPDMDGDGSNDDVDVWPEDAGIGRIPMETDTQIKDFIRYQITAHSSMERARFG